MKKFNLLLQPDYLVLLLCLIPIANIQAACIPVTKSLIINKPGHYCLTKNIQDGPKCAPPYNTIQIETNNVIVDFKGHTLYSKGVTQESCFNGGIGAIGNNIIIRNGTIRGFETCVALGGIGSVVENMSITGCAGGVETQGGGHVVRNNRFISTNLLLANAISVNGTGDWFVNNYIKTIGLYGTITAGPFSILENNRMVVEGNFGAIQAYKPSVTFTLKDNIIHCVKNCGDNNPALALKGGAVLRNNIFVGFKKPYQFDKPQQIIDGGGNIPALPK